MTVILRTVRLHAFEVRIVGRRYRHMIADRVPTDDEATSMNTCTTYSSLKHLRILDCIRQCRVVRRLRLLQFPRTLNSIGEIHLHTLWQTVRDSLTKRIRKSEGYFLHTSHILDGVLSGHRGIGDDMGTVLMSIFILHPFQYPTTSVIVEVGIDIRQRYSVRVQETLEQQVIL